MRTIKPKTAPLPTLNKQIVVALTVVVASLTLFSPLEALSIQWPRKPVAPTNYSECFDLGREYDQIYIEFSRLEVKCIHVRGKRTIVESTPACKNPRHTTYTGCGTYINSQCIATENKKNAVKQCRAKVEEYMR